MPRKSTTGNVRKRCGCAKWRTCEHPWYLDYQSRNRRYRKNLDVLTGRHADGFVEATRDGRLAILALLGVLHQPNKTERRIMPPLLEGGETVLLAQTDFEVQV